MNEYFYGWDWTFNVSKTEGGGQQQQVVMVYGMIRIMNQNEWW